MQSVAYKNDNSACLNFLKFMSPPHRIFSTFWFLEHKSATVRNSLMVLGRIIQWLTASVRGVACKNDNSAHLSFLVGSPDLYFYFIFLSGRATPQPLQIF